MKNLSLFFLTLFLFSCSSVDKNLTEYRKKLSLKKYDEASKFLEKSKIKKDKDSKLLYLMEKGMLAFHKQEFSSAINYFSEALDYRDKLYTQSISKKVKSSAFNSNFDDYIGSSFEISQIYYFQALSYYQLRLKESDDKKRKELLYQVRATALAWDTFFKTLKRSNRKTNEIFVDDFFARMAGANLHELLGTRREQEIAFLLYKDSLKILNTLGPTLKVFNDKYDNYIKNLKKSKNHRNIAYSEDFKALQKNIQSRILILAMKFRPNKVNQLKKSFNFSAKEFSELKTLKKKNHLTIMLLADQIPDKVPDEVNISLRGAIENSKDPGTKAVLQGIALPLLTMFAANTLQLNYVTKPYGNNIYMRHNALEAFSGEIGISFELPRYPDVSFKKYSEIIITNLETKKSRTEKLVLSGPLFEIAKQDLDEAMASEYWRTGTRVALKYLAAIVTAYTLYKQELNKKDQSGFGKLAILGGYFAATRGIKASEAADLRNWGSLPANIFSTRIYLDPGKYSIKLKNNEQVSEIGTAEITSKHPAIFTAIIP